MFAPSLLKLLAWCLMLNKCSFKRKSVKISNWRWTNWHTMCSTMFCEVPSDISGGRWQRVKAVTDRHYLIVPVAPQRLCHLSSPCWHSCLQFSSPLAAQKHKYVTRNKACCSMDRRFVFWTPSQYHVTPPPLHYSHALPKSNQNYTQSTRH
jgi:hypothetical protein